MIMKWWKYIRQCFIWTILIFLIIKICTSIFLKLNSIIQPFSFWISFELEIILAFIISFIMTIFRYHHDKVLNEFNDRVSQISEHGNIILEPSHWLAPLAQTVNQLQKQQQDQLQKAVHNTNILDTVWNDMPIGIIEITANRKILRINSTAMKILKLSIDVIGNQYDDMLNYHDLIVFIERGISKKGNYQKMITLEQDNKAKFLDLTMKYYQSSEQVNTAVIAFYDITDLVEAQFRQTQFLANVSHELKTPLTSIHGFTETLLDDTNMPSEVQQEFIGIISQETERLLDLTNDILSLIKTGDQVLSIVKIDVNKVVQDILKVQSQTINEKKLQLDLNTNLFIDYYLEPFKQILNNLISNAIKYNQINGKIWVKVEKIGLRIKINVKDTGFGISSNEKDKIFDRFYRVEKTRNKNIPGTGLGLSIVREWVDKLHGTINVKSQLSVGTTIKIELPIK